MNSLTYSKLLRPLALTALGILTLSGCEIGQACDASAYSSVNVSLVDSAGEPTTAAGVEWRLEGETDFQAAECVGAGEPCDDFVAGWEVAGSLEIQVVDCPESAVVVMVEQGECHVVSQQHDLVVPDACMPVP